ncbi:DUF6612 family protein [Fervidibacillus albus]|uniref:DUF4292 domain-containing protein n=1 Tax=Fervidibacillus albus TaxID=2980026 RepID=A0A9E8RXY6_9BACI|nr:DUF6612 family protein [Fervidibacillus albus]WAA10052.1 DUF4292 domain-containing protein [Fervidibacillus albus]
MKKFLFVFFLSLFLFSLTACNQGAEKVETEEGTEEKVNEEVGEEAKEDPINLTDVFQNTMEASSSLQSYSVQMATEQDITNNTTSETIHTEMTMEMDVTTDPLAIHQNLSMSAPEPVQMEMYFTEEGYFVYEPISDMWMKMSGEMFQQFQQLPEEKTNPYEQIQQMEQYVDDFSLQENDSEYILSLNVEGDAFLDFVKQQSIDFSNGEGDVGYEDSMDSVSLDQLDYTITVDKETFLPKKMEMTMQMQLDENGEQLTMLQKSNFTYNNYNGIDQIIVPEEIVNNAVDFEF